MFATIWMCTHEWSLIWSRTTALTFETCHQPLSSGSAFARSRTRRNLRFPRSGSRIRMCSTASAGVSRASRTASADAGSSIRASVSGSRVTRSTGAATLSPCASRRRKYVTARAIAPNGATTACAIVLPTRIWRNSGRDENAAWRSVARDDGQQAGDDDDREHRPAVAANERARATERLERASPLDHDHGGDHRPDRQEEEAGDDRARPAKAIPRPARSPATTSDATDDETRAKTWPIVASNVPSRASWTA